MSNYIIGIGFKRPHAISVFLQSYIAQVENVEIGASPTKNGHKASTTFQHGKKCLLFSPLPTVTSSVEPDSVTSPTDGWGTTTTTVT